MTNLFFILMLLVPAISYGDPVTTVEVKDESCPFMRWGSDVKKEKLFKSMADLTATLQKFCKKGGGESSASRLQTLLTLHEEEIKKIGESTNGSDSGTREIAVSCENNHYQQALSSAYNLALERIKAGKKASKNYEAAFDPAKSLEEKQTEALRIYNQGLTEWTKKCDKEKKDSGSSASAAAKDLSFDEVKILARNTVTEAEQCYKADKEKNKEVRDSVITTIVELSALAAASQPVSAGAAYGVLLGKDMLSHVLHAFSSGGKIDEEDLATETQDRENACVFLNALKSMFNEPGCAEDAKALAVKTPAPPGPPEMVDYVLALTDLQDALNEIQRGNIDSIIRSKAKPHPLDKVNRALQRNISTSVHDGPDATTKGAVMELGTYLAGLSNALYNFAAPKPKAAAQGEDAAIAMAVAAAGDVEYNHVSLDHAERLKYFMDVHAKWLGTSSPIPNEPGKPAMPALPPGMKPSKAFVLRSRGWDPAVPYVEPATEEKTREAAELFVDIGTVVQRYWAGGTEDPYARFIDWQKTHLKDMSAATLRAYVNTQTGPPKGAPPQLAFPIDHSAENMNRAFSSLTNEFKPRSDKMFLRAAELLENSGIKAYRPRSDGKAGGHILSFGKGSHTDLDRPTAKTRDVAAAPALKEPTTQERKDRSQKFDTFAMAPIRACGYLSAAQFLCTRETVGTQSNMCFEELPGMNYPWKGFGGKIARRAENATNAALGVIGVPKEKGFQLMLTTCAPLACKNSPVKGLSVFEHTAPVDARAQEAWKSSELNRFKKEYCRNLGKVDDAAMRLKANYECFDQLCAPPEGDPAWNLPCGQAIKKAASPTMSLPTLPPQYR